MLTTTTNKHGKILVAVPSYNGGDETIDCFKALLAYSPADTIFVAIDNNSTDGSVARLVSELPEVVVIDMKENSGYAGAAGRALEIAKLHEATVLVLVNQDVLVTPNWLLPLLDALQDDDVGAVQPVVVQTPSGNLNSVGNSIHYLGFGYASGNGASLASDVAQKLLTGDNLIVYASGACVAYKVEVASDIGFMLPDFFMYHEDLDYGWWLRMCGYKSVVVAESHVTHRYEFGRSLKIKYEYGERNRWRVLLMNYQFKTWLLILPMLVVMEVGIVMLSIWGGWFKEKVLGYGFIIKELPAILNERRRRQGRRTINDKQVVQGFADKIEYQEGAGVWLTIANPVLAFYWRLIKHLL